MSAAPRLLTANRSQVILATVDVEKLIADDHPARAIWEFVGRLDLEPYQLAIKSVEGSAGRPAYDPRLLVSIWILATSMGEGSAREIERLCSFHPAYQWLTGMAEINHHTLSDFRVDHREKLDELFTQVLGLLSAENLITLERITQDGTKIKACASLKSFRGEEKIRTHLELARTQVAAMGDPRESDGKKRETAKARGLNDRRERLEKALEQLPKIRELKKSEVDKRDARVSETDPEARIMKQSGGGFAPSYNVQLSVDAAHDVIVNVDVTQSGTDHGELTCSVRKVEERTGIKPAQVVADTGYTNHANILSMSDAKIDFYGSFPDKSGLVDATYERRGIAPEFRNEAFHYDAIADKYVCPAGHDLHHAYEDTRRNGIIQHAYEAKAGICAACPHLANCYPGMKKQGRQVMRSVALPQIVAFHEKMETAEAKAIYRTRSKTAEFPNAWIKEKFGLRQFRTRGKEKTNQEALWASITYNIQQWIRLIWRPQLAASLG